MAYYLVADYVAKPYTGKPYWRATGVFPSVVQAMRWAGVESIVTEWQDMQSALQDYDNRLLPDTGNYKVLA